MNQNEKEPVRPSPQILKAAVNLWTRAGGQHEIRVSGQSMSPLFHDGDTILVSHEKKHIRRGAIVVFQDITGLIAHRVLSITKGEAGELVFLTKGDNLLQCDPPIHADDVIGQAIALIHGETQVNLENPTWQRLNGLIAFYMLALAKGYHFMKNLKWRFSRPLSTPTNGWGSRTSLATSSLVLKALYAILGRWKA